MAGNLNFKFRIAFWNNFFWRFKKHISLSEKKPPLEGRAKISVIFDWDFGRNDDLINSFWSQLTFKGAIRQDLSKFIFVICLDSLQFRSHFTWWGWVLAHHNISLSLCVNGYHSLLPPGQTLKSSRENKTENGHFLKWKASIWMRGQTWGQQNSAHQSHTG